MASLDIIELIEKNPISKLTSTYNVKLLNKIKANFSETEQQLFIGTFYCYLNYDTKKDFVIDFDNVWKWMGFSRKGHAKTTLEKHFTIDNKLPGRDNKFAFNPQQFSQMVNNIRDAEKSLKDLGKNYQKIEKDIVKNYRGRWEPKDYK